MDKSRIFLASSGRTLVLAEKLRDELQTEFCEATLWSEESKKQISLTIIEMLEQASKEYDYVVIILSRDDLIPQGAAHEGEQQAKTVYNCIFEAGLFMDALGRERCFLVTDLESGLPVDLHGFIHIPFDVPSDLRNLVECRMAIRQPVAKILDTIQRRGRLIRRELVSLLSASELLQREKPKVDGGELEEGLVVVADIEPCESNQSAIQIRRNLDFGVRYVYFWQANEDNAMRICSFLQIILLAGLKDFDVAQAEAFQYRLEMIKRQQEEVLNTLQNMCVRESLIFYFMPDEPAFPLRMHNTTSVARGKAYLRYGDRGFVEWRGRRSTVDNWREWQRYLPEQEPEAVFRSTRVYSLRDEGRLFRRSIEKAVGLCFPEIEARVAEFCFGKETGEQ